MVLDNKNQVSTFGVIFLGCLAIVAINSLTGLDFGPVGIIAWAVVIIAASAFVIKLIDEISR
ncbi:hypothetical protein ES702_03876 [subsurface metagenome]